MCSWAANCVRRNMIASSRRSIPSARSWQRHPPVAEYAHLGPFSDLVAAARKQGPLFPREPLDRETAREVLRFTLQNDQPADVWAGRKWSADDIDGEELSWS